jgi:hypothetical protein
MKWLQERQPQHENELFIQESSILQLCLSGHGRNVCKICIHYELSTVLLCNVWEADRWINKCVRTVFSPVTCRSLIRRVLHNLQGRTNNASEGGSPDVPSPMPKSVGNFGEY